MALRVTWSDSPAVLLLEMSRETRSYYYHKTETSIDFHCKKECWVYGCNGRVIAAVNPEICLRRKGKPKINLTKWVKKDDLTPLQTFIHVLTIGGNLRLNMSWHLKNDSLYYWFSGMWNWPAHHSLFGWNMSRKTWRNFKRSLGRDNRGLLTSRILRNRGEALGL